jgi:hypothetical protein
MGVRISLKRKQNSLHIAQRRAVYSPYAGYELFVSARAGFLAMFYSSDCIAVEILL